MEEVDTPIVAGAQYEDIDGETVRVRSVWVDEDLTTQVQIFHEDEYAARQSHRSVPLDDFVSRIGPTDLERVNSDHDAWEWRQE
jgi:hypothetical protein